MARPVRGLHNNRHGAVASKQQQHSSSIDSAMLQQHPGRAASRAKATTVTRKPTPLPTTKPHSSKAHTNTNTVHTITGRGALPSTHLSRPPPFPRARFSPHPSHRVSSSPAPFVVRCTRTPPPHATPSQSRCVGLTGQDGQSIDRDGAALARTWPGFAARGAAMPIDRSIGTPPLLPLHPINGPISDSGVVAILHSSYSCLCRPPA